MEGLEVISYSVLINHARDRKALKRGGADLERVTLDAAVAAADERVVDVLELEEALRCSAPLARI